MLGDYRTAIQAGYSFTFHTKLNGRTASFFTFRLTATSEIKVNKICEIFYYILSFFIKLWDELIEKESDRLFFYLATFNNATGAGGMVFF